MRAFTAPPDFRFVYEPIFATGFRFDEAEALPPTPVFFTITNPSSLSEHHLLMIGLFCLCDQRRPRFGRHDPSYPL